MNDIQVFNNPQFGAVRTAGTADNPMFCLADVCNAIGINNSRVVKNRLDEDDVSLIDTMTSVEVSMITGKQHSHVMEAIRKMEPAREKVSGSKFRLTSLQISEVTGKRHDNVMRDIRNLLKQGAGVLNFEETTY